MFDFIQKRRLNELKISFWDISFFESNLIFIVCLIYFSTYYFYDINIKIRGVKNGY